MRTKILPINYTEDLEKIAIDEKCGEVGIIRDTTLIPIEDFIEGLFENFEMYGDCKIFIEV